MVTDIKQIKDLEKQLIKKFGEDYFPISQEKVRKGITFRSTGCLSLDRVLGKGLPEGRLVEFYGDPSSFKSTLALQCIKAYQQQGLICALIDAECAFDPAYAKALGVDPERLMILTNLRSAEEYIEGLLMIVEEPYVNLVILDSVSSLVPKRIIEGEVGDVTMAVMARYWSTHMPQIITSLSKNNNTLLLINQQRTNLGKYGTPSDPTGGNALKFYKSVSMYVKREAPVKENGKEVGVSVKLTVKKTKVGGHSRPCAWIRRHGPRHRRLDYLGI